ncbi:MAG: thioesterase II family protein [Pseudonocardia sp.]
MWRSCRYSCLAGKTVSNEPAIDSADLLAGRLLEGLVSYLDRLFALFGHSMGALIAFELARQLRTKGLESVQVFVSGCKAPHLPRDRSKQGSPAVPVGAFHDCPGSLGQHPPRVRVAMAMSASGLW